MIKVLHILPSFSVVGAESIAIYMMRYLDCERFEVAAVSLYSGHSEALKKILGQDDLTVSYLSKKPGFDWRMYARIDYTLRRFRPQVVHSHLGVLRYALPSMLRHRVPAMIHTVHSLAD